MAKTEIQFVGNAYTMRSLQLDAQNCINWYMTVDPTGKYKSALLPRPGLQLFSNDIVVDPPSFIGSGLDDLLTTGNYTETYRTDFRVKIYSSGTPDTFIFSSDGGSTWTAVPTSITGDYQDLTLGVQIKFTSTTGHTVDDYWVFAAYSENSGRGAIALNEVLYAVIDDKFYIYSTTGSRVIKGYLKTTQGQVRLLANDFQIGIFDGSYGYVYQIVATQYYEADTFREIDRSSSYIDTPVFSGSGANNLSVTAVYTGDSSRNYIVEIDGARSTFSTPVFYGYYPDILLTKGVFEGDSTTQYRVLIDSVTTITYFVFVGTGLDDASLRGSYNGFDSRNFLVMIDSVGTPDTFTASNDGGNTWFATNVAITGSDQMLLNNVYINFSSTTGHTLNDLWSIGVVPKDSSSSVDTFRWSNDGGSTWKKSSISITGEEQTLESGVKIIIQNTTGHGLGDYWDFSTQLSGIEPDTFRWSRDNGVTWVDSNIPITTGLQLLEDGIYISFLSDTAHALYDSWSFLAQFQNTFIPPLVPTYQDGYGVYPQQNSQRFYYTTIDDFNRVDPLGYESAITYADNIAGSASMSQELYMIGYDSVQVYHTSTDPDLPFASRTNFVLNYGCIAPYTIQAGSDNVLFMLARNKSGERMIVAINNYDVKIISTEAMMDEFLSYPKVSDAFAFIIEMTTNVFYVITFPSADKTWAYNLKMGSWAEWSSTWETEFPMETSPRQGMFRGSFHVVFGGKNILGDVASGKLYVFTDDSNTDNGNFIMRQRTAPHLYLDDDWITVNSLIIDVQRGLTKDNTPPQLMLQISRDGGQTWGSELWRNSGNTGQYRHRAMWLNLGCARNFTFRLTITDSAYNVVLGAVADIERSE